MTNESQKMPVDITVHTLPQQEGAAALLEVQSRTRLGRLKMLIVLALCAAPVIASYLTYYVLRPQHSGLFTVKSFGELVQPQKPMPDMSATTLRGERVPLSSLRRQWLLASKSGGACGKTCQNNLYVQRQLRETLGAEKDRLDWVWLISDDAPLDPLLQKRLLDPNLKGFNGLRVNAQQLNAWLQGEEDQLYLVDPLGNYMMRFPPNLNPETAIKAKRDIDRVLRASASWDTPGRDKP